MVFGNFRKQKPYKLDKQRSTVEESQQPTNGRVARARSTSLTVESRTCRQARKKSTSPPSSAYIRQSRMEAHRKFSEPRSSCSSSVPPTDAPCCSSFEYSPAATEDEEVQYGYRSRSLKEAFEVFDADHDGRITCNELYSVLRFLDASITEVDAQRMIHDADLDGNGTVEYNEFVKMMNRYNKANMGPNTDEEEFREAFRVFDRNGDQFIDFNELKNTMHFLGERVSDEEVHAMIREADVDNDGRICFEEFKKMMSLMRGARHG